MDKKPFSSHSNYNIYTLIDPRDNQVRYVGITCNPVSRYNAHLAALHGEGSPEKRAWIKGLRSNGLKPEMVIIENDLTREIALENERKWIRYYQSQGCAIFNNANLKIRPEEVVSLLKAHYDLLNQFGIQDTEEWIEAKETLQIQTQELLESLGTNYHLRPFVRYQSLSECE